jgi:hypothetical protein
MLAWGDSYQAHDPMFRAIVKHGDMSQSDLDDVVQEIWLLLVRRLPKSTPEDLANMALIARFRMSRTGAESGPKASVRNVRKLLVVTVTGVVISGLCLKLRTAPFVWFWLVWASALVALIFCVRGSWPRALFFNAAVVTLFLAATEAYYSWVERELPTYSTEFYTKDELLGWAPRKSTRTRSTRYQHGRKVFDAAYTSDANGLRVSPPPGKDPRTGMVLFFGCSYAFGHGLDDDQTLPYQVETKSSGRWRTLNFGVDAYGPQHMLALVESGRVRRIVASSPRYAIYEAIPQHVERVAGRTSWGKDGPQFRLDAHDTPRMYGHFDQTGAALGFLESLGRRSCPMFVSAVSRQLDKSAFYRKQSIADAAIAPGDVRLYMGVVGRSRDLLMTDYPGLEFHVILWPDEYTGNPTVYRELLSGFRQLKIPVHRVEDIVSGCNVDARRKDQTRYLIAPTEPHPNALSNQVLAEYVVTRVLSPVTQPIPNE